jgi:NAD(P)H-binding
MIVVLGAFGRTGRVVAALSRAAGGERVRLVTRDAARSQVWSRAEGDSRVEAKPEVAVASLLDDVELGRVLRGARALYAILPDDLRSKRFHAERRAMAEAMARAIGRERVPRVVLLSSRAAALGEHGQNGFASDLAHFERLVLDTNAAVSVLRASYFQDNVVEALPMAQRDGVYLDFFEPTVAPITTIAAVDVGTIAARSLLEPPRSEREIVELLGPAYTPAEIATAVGTAIGQRLSVQTVPVQSREELFRQWLSPEAARAMVETLACLGSGRLVAVGDRVERGQTTLAQVLHAALARTAPASAGLEVST